MRAVVITVGTLVLLLYTGSTAHAATISGTPEDSRLDVYFRAAPGETNELRVLASESEVRFVGSPPLVAGEHCAAVGEREVRCGPRGLSGLGAFTRLGDGNDVVFAPIGGVVLGDVVLGSGDDVARGTGLILGRRGKDDMRALRIGARVQGGARFHGGRGEDVLIGGPRGDLLDGGPGPDLAVGGRRFDELQGGRGPDQLAGGLGRDVIFAGPGDDVVRATDTFSDLIRCGPGRDVAYVAGPDRTTGCERVLLGRPG